MLLPLLLLHCGLLFHALFPFVVDSLLPLSLQLLRTFMICSLIISAVIPSFFVFPVKMFITLILEYTEFPKSFLRYRSKYAFFVTTSSSRIALTQLSLYSNQLSRPLKPSRQYAK